MNKDFTDAILDCLAYGIIAIVCLICFPILLIGFVVKMAVGK